MDLPNLDPIIFDDLAPVEVSVKIGQLNCILREASEDAACKYRNASLKAARMQSGEIVGMDGLADSEPYLVSLCLFEIFENGKGQKVERPVALSVIRSWKAGIVKTLFERIRQISNLEDKGDQAKNSPGAGPTTSALPDNSAPASTS
jgi:hypothetical protein